jgi:hypothetical protein
MRLVQNAFVSRTPTVAVTLHNAVYANPSIAAVTSLLRRARITMVAEAVHTGRDVTAA